MTKAQAMKLARAAYENRWPGDDRKAHLRYNPKGGTAETRASASAELKLWRSRKAEQTTADDMREWKRREAELIGRATSYRCSVGYIGQMPMFGAYFGIQGQGDTWAEACEKAGILPKPEEAKR